MSQRGRGQSDARAAYMFYQVVCMMLLDVGGLSYTPYTYFTRYTTRHGQGTQRDQ